MPPHVKPKKLLALSIRQPWAELILRGVKTIEERSQSTNVRGRIYIYASLGRYPAKKEAEWADEHGLDVVSLPRGVIVGTVELFDCVDGDDYQHWLLRDPIRLEPPLKPQRRPNPVWSYPFGPPSDE